MKNFFTRLPIDEPQTPLTVVEETPQPRMSARMLERYIEATQNNLLQLGEREKNLQDEIRFLIQEHKETKTVIEAQKVALARLQAATPPAATSTDEDMKRALSAKQQSADKGAE